MRVYFIMLPQGANSAGLAHPLQAGLPSVPIVVGSQTVLIEYKPAARWIMDTAACGTFLGDLILLSTRKVFIG
jgi:uncharacterized Zn-binding protein involved in type VI secretion